MKRNIIVIAKASLNCNLRCNYCYVKDYENNAMDSNLLEKMFNFIPDAPHLEKVTYLWHGGEPLLPGIDFYRTIIKMQKKLDTKYTIVNNVQTNGTLITQEFCDFFKKEDFKIGISVDGPRAIHNKNRISVTGEGSFDKVMDGINLLKKNSINFGIVAVLYPDTDISSKSLYDFFNSLGAVKVKFQPAYYENISKNDLYLLEKRIAELYELWVNDKNCKVIFDPFTSIAESFIYNRNTGCQFSSDCLGGNFFSVNPDGDIYLCGRMDSHNVGKLGNLDDSFDSIVQASLNHQQKRNKNIQTVCSDCEYLRFCYGGCAAESWEINSDLYDKSPHCIFYKDIFKKLKGVTAK